MHRLRALALATLAATVTACATGGTGAGRSGRNVITAQDIAAAGLTTFSALEVIERLRDRWLRESPSGSLRDHRNQLPRVFINDIEYGGPEQLSSLRAEAIEVMRYLSPREATMRYGTGYGAGAILVVQKTGGTDS